MQLAAAMQQPVGSLRDELHKHIARQDADRPPWNLHSSDITSEKGFCARYPVLMREHKIPLPTRYVTTSMAVTWEWGRLVERRVIEWFADMGLAHGDWLCQHHGCSFIHEWRTRPTHCIKCGGKAFKYIEPRAMSAYSGASSGLDMLIRFPARPYLTFTEIKSIDPDKFKELLMPLAEHRIRTTLSLRNIAESADPRMKEVDNSVGFTLYVSKGGYGTKTPSVAGGFTPFKEFKVHRNDDAVAVHAEASRSAFLALKGEGPLPERFCKHHTDKKAQSCPAFKQCWAGVLK